MGFERHVELHRLWCQGLIERLRGVEERLRAHALLQPALSERVERLVQALQNDRIRVAVVGAPSRGKTELINAVLLGSVSQPLLPMGSQATTLCPLDIEASSDGVDRLRLLPTETRRLPWSMAHWRESDEGWQSVDLGSAPVAPLAQALSRVGNAQRVPVEQAQVLGLLGVGSPSLSATLAAPEVEIARWRRASLALNHPLLAQGLVLFDTPGLSIQGPEPEWITDLLPPTQSVLFVLAADVGVAPSDLDVWQRYVQALAQGERKVWVVLNKIDALRDTTASPEGWLAAIEHLRERVADTLGVPRERVLPVSAREACQAQASRDSGMLQRSAWSEAWQLVGEGLLERQRAVVMRQLRRDLVALFQDALQAVHTQQRELIDHTLELQALESKNTRLLQQMRWRLGQEQSGLDSCLARVQSAREQQVGLLREFFVALGPVRLRTVMNDLAVALADPGLGLNLKSLYQNTFVRLRGDIEMASRELADMHARLQAQARTLNVEQGLNLVLIDPPDLRAFAQQLDQIQAGYAQYLGWSTAVQRLKNGFGVRVAQTLMGRLQSMFDTLLNDIEQWHRANQDQMEAQLRGRRHHCAKRQDALAKVQQAAGELQRRTTDLQGQRQALDRLNDILLQWQRQCLPASSVAPVSEVVHGQ